MNFVIVLYYYYAALMQAAEEIKWNIGGHRNSPKLESDHWRTEGCSQAHCNFVLQMLDFRCKFRCTLDVDIHFFIATTGKIVNKHK